MSVSSLLDLDALPAKCYTRSGKTFLQEAIQCYRVGALRAAMLSTWQSIVFDYIEKLEELSLDNDPFAKVKLSDFKRHAQAGNVQKLLEFEREILSQLKDDLQFISVTEETDLERIRDDRNRCSHPTFNFDEEPFAPSPEQVRAHIVNAFNILLSQPPTYGKAALNGILDYFQSSNFPEEDEIAVARLSKTRLGTARKSLVFNLVKVLLKFAFATNRQTAEFYFHKISLALKVHRDWVLECFKSDCEKIFSSAEINGHFHWILHLIGSDPEIFGLLSPYFQKEVASELQKIITGVTQFDLDNSIGTISKIPTLLSVINENIRNLRTEQVEMIFKEHGQRSYFDEIFQRYCKARNWSETGVTGRILIVHNKHLSPEQIENIFVAFKNNHQIRTYINNSHVIESLAVNKLVTEGRFRELVEKNSLTDYFTEERIMRIFMQAA